MSVSFVTAFITRQLSDYTVDVVALNQLHSIAFLPEYHALGFTSKEAVEEYLADIEVKSGELKRIYLTIEDTTTNPKNPQ